MFNRNVEQDTAIPLTPGCARGYSSCVLPSPGLGTDVERVQLPEPLAVPQQDVLPPVKTDDWNEIGVVERWNMVRHVCL